jgi:hypothetical protein
MNNIEDFKRREMADPKSKLGSFYRIQKAMNDGLRADQLSDFDAEMLCSYDDALRYEMQGKIGK